MLAEEWNLVNMMSLVGWRLFTIQQGVCQMAETAEFRGFAIQSTNDMWE
jgi:hypothetical protein